MTVSAQFANEVAESRSYLLRFARLQLRNDAWAEDVVAETMLAAIEKPQNFAGRASLRTWLVGILKHKLIDQIRRNSREISSSASDDDGVDLEELLFKPDGHWREISSPPRPSVSGIRSDQ